MPTIEGLNAAANLTGQIQQHTEQMNDNAVKRFAGMAAAQAAKQGNYQQAFGIMGAVDPKFLQAGAQFDPATQGKLAGAESQAKLPAQLEVQKQQIQGELDLQSMRNKAAVDMSNVKSERSAKEPSIGESAVDKAFAKEYTDFIAKGGYTNAQKNLDALKQVSDEIAKTDTATGGFIGLLPKIVRDVVTPEGAAMQDKVEQVVQSNLRQVLGAQFTEKEGQMLLARSYNPRLSEKENQQRLKSLVKQIEGAYSSQKDAARYFEDNGTLKGFKGKIIQSIDDIIPAPTDEHQQALEFIAANPNDPRVPAIRKKLGL